MTNHPNRKKGPQGPSLVHSALDVVGADIIGREAGALLIDGINGDLGTAYDTARLGQWRRGERSIPQDVQDWMLRACVRHAVEACGGIAPASDDALDHLAAMLCPPKRRAER